MAIKGLTTPAFADYVYNGASVSYVNGFVCGSAIEYGVDIEATSNNPQYGDNHIINNDFGTFSTGTLTINTSDLTQPDSKRLLGRKEVQIQVGGATVTELVADEDAKATPKGFGVIETHQINDVDYHRAVILCKVTMNIPPEAASTKGETIEWQTRELTGTISRSDEMSQNYKHPWMREAWFDTEEEAMEYIRTALNVLDTVIATSEAGSSVGQTVVTIKNPVEGATYKYSTDGGVSTYKQDLTEWTDLPSGGTIEASNGTTIYLAQADSDGKAIGAGSVVAVSNGG